MTTQSPHPSGDARDGGAQSGLQPMAQHAAEQLQEQVQTAAGNTQHRLREQVDQRSGQLGGQLQQHASDLRTVGGALREQGQARPADLATRAARYLEQVGAYLQRSDANRILGDAEDIGRRRPAAVASGAAALGFAASRLMKASSQRRYASRPSTPRGQHEPAWPPDGASALGAGAGAVPPRDWPAPEDIVGSAPPRARDPLSAGRASHVPRGTLEDDLERPLRDPITGGAQRPARDPVAPRPARPRP